MTLGYNPLSKLEQFVRHGHFLGASDIAECFVETTNAADATSSVLICIHGNRLISSLCFFVSNPGNGGTETHFRQFNTEEVQAINHAVKQKKYHKIERLLSALEKVLDRHPLLDFSSGLKWHHDVVKKSPSSDRFAVIVGMTPSESHLTAGLTKACLFTLTQASVQLQILRQGDLMQMLKFRLTELAADMDVATDEILKLHDVGIPEKTVHRLCTVVKSWIKDASAASLLPAESMLPASYDRRARSLFKKAAQKLETKVDQTSQPGTWLLMVPIEELMLTGGSRCVGVLLIERSAKKTSAFSMTEIACVEIASRWVSLQRMRFSYRAAITANTELYHQLSRPPLASSNDMSQNEDDLLSLAKSRVQKTCERLFYLTAATFVHVRVMERSGDSLSSLVCIGQTPYPKDHKLVLSSSGCFYLSAEAVRRGESIYVPDTTAPSCNLPNLRLRLDQTNQRIRSIHSTPLKAFGRVVGTLTLGSVRQDAFGHGAELLASFSQLIALALESSVENEEAKLDAALGQIQIAKHELFKIARAIRDGAAGHGIDAASCNSLLNRLDGVLKGASARTIKVTNQTTVIEIVQRELAQSDPLRIVELKYRCAEGDPLLTTKLLPQCSQALTLALHEVLANAKDKSTGGHSYTCPIPSSAGTAVARDEATKLQAYIKRMNATWRRHSVQLFISKRRIGGEFQICLEVENPTRRASIPSNIENRLFRVPVEDQDGIHYGAFVAGQAMRHVGGDIYLQRNSDHMFCVRIELPESSVNPPRHGNI